MTNEELAQHLLDLCGGTSNIVHAENCMTRLRVTLKDASKVKRADIEKTEDVIGLIGEGTELQIVIGPGKVQKVTDAFLELRGKEGASSPETDSPTEPAKKKKGGLNSGLRKLSQIFVPLIPGIMAAGLLLGITSILTLLVNQGVIQSSDFLSGLILLFNIIANGCLSFLPIFVGINSAKVFKCSTILGGLIGGIVMLESINDLAILLNNFGSLAFGIENMFYDANNIQDSLLTQGKGGVIGALIGVWILSKVERFMHKHVPDTLDLIVVPLVSAVVAGTVMILVIMPVTGLLSAWIVAGLQWLGNSSLVVVQVIYGFILGATFLPMVMLGLHQSLVPIYFLELDQLGYISMIAPQMMAGGANIGAAIAVYFKAKSVGHTGLKKIIAGSLPTAILGIHEPLIYGMTLPIAVLFIPIGIGAGIGGIWCVLTDVYAASYGPATLLGVATMQPESMLNYLIGLVISCAAALLFTQFMIPKKRIKAHMEGLEDSSDGDAANNFNKLFRS